MGGDDRGSGRAADTRSRLLEVSARTFADRGFRETSVSAIARVVDVSPSTVFFHFSNKQDLFVAAYTWEANRLCDAVIGDPQAASDYWEQVFFEFVTAVPDYPLILRVLRGQEPTLMPHLVTGTIPDRLRSALKESLIIGQDSGTIRSDLDPETTAVAMEAILTALLLATVQAAGAGRTDRADAVRAFLHHAISS